MCDYSNHSSFSIQILPVLFGDAFHLTINGYDTKKNHIFIDGGFQSTYQLTLKKEIDKLRSAAEPINLFVITHTDHDHIGGVLKFIKDFGNEELVKMYWFNNIGEEVALASSDRKISISDGIKLRDFLKSKGLLFPYPITDELSEFQVNGSTIKVLSPSRKILDDFYALWSQREELSSDENLIYSKLNDYQYDIDQLNGLPFVEDKKLENRASIAFIFENSGKKILFLSDSHPSDIASNLMKIGYGRTRKLKIDYTILSHHGSKYNTSPELTSMIDCDKFIISANGKNRYNFPHKEPLARILKNPYRDSTRKIVFYFNYDNDLLRGMFTDLEKFTYNFDCIYPEGESNGITIHC